MREATSKEKITNDILEWKTKNNKIPTRKEYGSTGFCNIKTVYEKCGNWHDLMAELFGNEYLNRFCLETPCQNCGKIFTYPKHDKRVFCSSSCAATYNNKRFPKRQLEGKCSKCGKSITNSKTYCSECWKLGKFMTDGKQIGERTLEEVSKYPGMARYNIIRTHARGVMKKSPKICQKCGYSLHTEVCHIKEIKLFPLTALVKEVNDPSNLLVLCSNCHWEMDHGIWTVDKLVPPSRLELASSA